MAQVFKTTISFIIANIPFVTLVLAVILGIISASGKKQSHNRRQNINRFVALMLLLPVGIAGIWGFIMHAFFPALSASYIGWQPSPFQFEVALANLGIGVTGILATSATMGFRVATTIMTTCFLWGAAVGHIIQMHHMSDFSPGNAGTIFYSDILTPLILIILLMMHRKSKQNVFS